MSAREIFVEKLKAKLSEWNAEVDRLESKAEMIDAQNRARYRAAIQEIKGKIQQVERKLTVIKNSSTDAWQDLKEGAETAWKDFEASMNQVKERFTGGAP
jgi:predicted  nucleic acid-binding Zn-ribbon protein